MIERFLFAYALAGIYTALVVATVDLMTPEKPAMGVGWTLVSGVLWPVFTAVTVAYVLGWRPRGT